MVECVGGRLDEPAFSPGILTYRAEVQHENTELALTPTTTYPQANTPVNGATVASGASPAPIALAAGNAEITVEATAEDDDTRAVYALSISRMSFPAYAGVLRAARRRGQRGEHVQLECRRPPRRNDYLAHDHLKS